MTGSTFLRHFERAIGEFPDSIAFDIGGRSCSYRELANRVQGIRDLLERTCSADEICIAVVGTQEIETYATIIAILASGRAYLPLNPKAPDDRNQSCLAQAKVRTILASRPSSALAKWCAALGLQSHLSSGIPEQPWRPIGMVGESTMAYLLFTSGSTGIPKGVPIYHRNLNAFLDAIMVGTDWRVNQTDRVLQMFDLTFDLSIMSYALPLCVGATCVVVPDGGAGFIGVAKTLDKGAVTVALMVPSVLAFLERYFPEISLPKLRLSMFCGEALPTRLARAWWTCAPQARLLNVYGPTEATIFISCYELQPKPTGIDDYNGVVGIGLPLEGSAFRVVNEKMQSVPNGEKGELVLMGGQVTTGYWSNPERTALAFVELPDGTRGYRTGDLVFAVDGQFFYAGRLDHQLKIDGYRVESGEIESRAREVDGVRDAVVVPEIREGRIVSLQLFVLTDDPSNSQLPTSCRAQLATALPPYMVPHKVHCLSEFPLNSNGKVDRRALADQIGAR